MQFFCSCEIKLQLYNFSDFFVQRRQWKITEVKKWEGGGVGPAAAGCFFGVSEEET